MDEPCLDEYLQSTDLIDWKHPQIHSIARSLRLRHDANETAARCFNWVRDEITHSFDVDAKLVSCTASETLENLTGICYAKSHLLAALLRANGIPTGFGYQRIALDDSGSRFCLHGFNYVHLPEHGWYAADPRGNRPDIYTEFAPPKVSLAFETRMPGERTLTTVFAEPLPSVAQCLRSHSRVAALQGDLPDHNG